MADKPLQAEIELTPTAEEPTYVLAPPRESAWSHHSTLLLFTLLWGGNFVLAEVALREMAPISFSVARFLMGGGAMLAILYLQCRAIARKNGARIRLFPSLDKEHWPRLLLVSVLGATLAPWLGIEGLSLTNGARASLWLALGPVFSVGIGGLDLGMDRAVSRARGRSLGLAAPALSGALPDRASAGTQGRRRTDAPPRKPDPEWGRSEPRGLPTPPIGQRSRKGLISAEELPWGNGLKDKRFSPGE